MVQEAGQTPFSVVKMTQGNKEPYVAFTAWLKAALQKGIFQPDV